MKKIILNLLITAFTFLQINAQVPTKPEDISPLLIGEKIPTTTINNLDGTETTTDAILNKKTVMVFYRGGWCPYCNKQLSGLQEIEKQIKDLGYNIVAVSPDAPDGLNKTVSKDKLSYTLVSDQNASLIKAVGIAFAGPQKYKDMLLKSSGGKNVDGILPVPTVYILNAKQEIQFIYSNPNYTTRLSGSLLLAVLKAL